MWLCVVSCQVCEAWYSVRQQYKLSIELPVATRHRRDMTEKLLKATLKPNNNKKLPMFTEITGPYFWDHSMNCSWIRLFLNSIRKGKQRNMRKPVFGVVWPDKTQTGLLSYRDSLESWMLGYSKYWSQSIQAKALFRLRRCAGWAGPLLFALWYMAGFPMTRLSQLYILLLKYPKYRTPKNCCHNSKIWTVGFLPYSFCVQQTLIRLFLQFYVTDTPSENSDFPCLILFGKHVLCLHL